MPFTRISFVIGGIAAIAHGVPRNTFDLDILIEPTLANANHLLIALNDAGFFKAPPPTCAELLEQAVTPFTDRECERKLDVHSHMERTSFDKAWQRKAEMTYECQAFYILSREDLIASKRASGRKQLGRGPRYLTYDKICIRRRLLFLPKARLRFPKPFVMR